MRHLGLSCVVPHYYSTRSQRAQRPKSKLSKQKARGQHVHVPHPASGLPAWSSTARGPHGDRCYWILYLSHTIHHIHITRHTVL